MIFRCRCPATRRRCSFGSLDERARCCGRRRFATVETDIIDEIQCTSDTDLTEALRSYFEKQSPVKLAGAVQSEPAIERWKTWEYLLGTVDQNRPCHVEIGGSYADEAEHSNIRFGDYIAYLQFFQEKYGRQGDQDPPKESLVYLAQNDVFPELRTDFTIPSFCRNLGEGSQYSCMVWIGPYGCVSPLHFDPLDNALMQFVGRKRVLLYPPGTSLYPGTKGYQFNTSPWNPEEPFDPDDYPELMNLPPALSCSLIPGDLLYIPRKWWHHVRTIETSVSINSWWR